MKPNWTIPLAAMIALVASLAPAFADNWTVTLDTSDQVASPGGTVIYTGTITNGTGAAISLEAGLDFVTSPEADKFTIEFSDDLLALDLIVPTGGYTGAIFEVSWAPDAVQGSAGEGQLQVLAVSPATPSILTAPFTLGTPGFGPFCSSGTAIGATSHSVASSDSLGNPAIAYNDAGAGTLSYAMFDGTLWSKTPIASGIGTQAAPSLAMDGDLRPHVAFYDEVGGNLVHAWDPGTGWQTEIIEATGNVGAEPSLVVDALGELHVSYYDVTNADLRYAHWSGGVWSVALVDAAGDAGHYSAITADDFGHPFISYYDATSEDLKFARKSGASWIAEVVEATGSIGTWTSIQVRSGVVSISYRDATSGSPSLKYASGGPGSWANEVVDATGDPGLGSSLQLNGFGQPRIAYFDAISSVVRFATKSGASWNVQPMITDGSERLSLGRSVSDEPYLSYTDGTSGELRLAALTTCGAVSVSERSAPPGLVLQPSRPNPFSQSTTFAFSIAREGDVRLRVYDTAGRLVAEPFRGALSAGPHAVTWNGVGRNGRKMAPGGYIFEVRAGGEARTGRVVMVR